MWYRGLEMWYDMRWEVLWIGIDVTISVRSWLKISRHTGIFNIIFTTYLNPRPKPPPPTPTNIFSVTLGMILLAPILISQELHFCTIKISSQHVTTESKTVMPFIEIWMWNHISYQSYLLENLYWNGPFFEQRFYMSRVLKRKALRSNYLWSVFTSLRTSPIIPAFSDFPTGKRATLLPRTCELLVSLLHWTRIICCSNTSILTTLTYSY
jgi:hypothetical protein